MIAIAAWYLLSATQSSISVHNIQHLELFGKDAVGFNAAILKGIDKVQSTAMDGGGYFIGVKADPPECPVGYNLCLLGKPLLTPTRTTSYCSGSSFAAFVEGMNTLLDGRTLEDEKHEAVRMQEPDGKRREDGVKFWGWWNADGYGNHFALVQYSGIGTQIKAADARPGDFMNISWKSGLGHSVVFLGWQNTQDGKPALRVWSSQKSTNGFGDLVAALDTIKEVLVVRITDPFKIFSLDPMSKVDTKLAMGESLDGVTFGTH